MGGPVLGFCAGRIDEPDGRESVLLGPTPEQEKQFPCPVNGECTLPLGTDTVEFIYVNAEGERSRVPETPTRPFEALL